MEQPSKKIRIFIIHLIPWIIYATVNHFLNILNYGGAFVFDTVTKYAVAAFIFYSNCLVIFPYFFKRRHYFSFTVSLILLSGISFLLKIALLHYVFAYFGYPVDEIPYTLFQSYLLNLSWWFQYSLWGLAYWLVREIILKEREKSNLEREKLHLEYTYLKSQINPHFLYNVLNFFYAKAFGGSQQLSDGILCLAEIMRYVIDNEEDKDGKVPIVNEMRQIQNVIDINQLRFDNKLNIKFYKEGIFSDVRVIPYVIVTLVENSFKHGKLSPNAAPIVIRLSHRGGILKLLVQNKKTNDSKISSAGIGIDNIRRRLSFAYGDRHEMVIKEDAENYSVNLSINLV